MSDEYEMSEDDYRRKEIMLQKRINNAVSIITQYGGIDGEHHKQWVMDQVVRCLTSGNEYEAFKEAIRGEYDPEEEAYTYDEWDEGIAP